MGLVVTTNSATLVNKGLEVIEAHLLFDVPYDRIEVDGAPAVDRALDGRVRRRLDDRPGQPARHAAADLARPRLAAPRARTSASRSTGRPRRPGSSSPSTPTRSRPSPSPSASARRAAPTRPSSTRPTSRPSRPSTPDASATSTSSTRSSGSSTPHEAAGELTLEGVLAAESWARSAADSLLTG